MKNKRNLVALSLVAALAATNAWADDNSTGSVSLGAEASNTCAIGKVIGGTQAIGVTQTATSWAGGGTQTDASSGFTDAAGVRTIAFGNLFNSTNALLVPGPTANVAGDVTNVGVVTRDGGAQFTVRAYCNYGSAAIKLRSSNGGMRLVNGSGTVIAPPPASGAFRNAINYSAVAYWGRGSGAGDTAQWVTTGETGTGNGTGRRFGGSGSFDVAGGAWTANGTSLAARNATVDVRIVPRNGMTVPEAGYLTASTRGVADLNTIPFLAGTYADTLTMRLGVTF